jgi:hypothetical protein
MLLRFWAFRTNASSSFSPANHSSTIWCQRLGRWSARVRDRFLTGASVDLSALILQARPRLASTCSPATSPRRQPLSMKVRSMAASRRSRTWRPLGSSAVFAGRLLRRRVRSWDYGWPHPRHRVGGSLALLRQPLEQLLEAAVPHRASRGPPALQCLGHERLDVVTGDAGHRRDAKVVAHEDLEPSDAVAVGAFGFELLSAAQSDRSNRG